MTIEQQERFVDAECARLFPLELCPCADLMELIDQLYAECVYSC